MKKKKKLSFKEKCEKSYQYIISVFSIDDELDQKTKINKIINYTVDNILTPLKDNKTKLKSMFNDFSIDINAMINKNENISIEADQFKNKMSFSEWNELINISCDANDLTDLKILKYRKKLMKKQFLLNMRNEFFNSISQNKEPEIIYNDFVSRELPTTYNTFVSERFNEFTKEGIDILTQIKSYNEIYKHVINAIIYASDMVMTKEEVTYLINAVLTSKHSDDSDSKNSFQTPNMMLRIKNIYNKTLENLRKYNFKTDYLN